MSRVLVVDDDDTFLKLMALALKQRGHDVECASDGDAGYRVFKTGRFDAVVCDIVMPEKEGIETIQHMRRDNAEVAIVAISGGLQFGHRSEIDMLQIVEKLGADVTLKKPFQMSALCAAVDEAIRSHATPAARARA